jgi:nitrilase
MSKRVGALQIGADPAGKGQTLHKILAFEDQIREAQLSLVVMPEALLGGYPKGEGFGTHLGYRLPEGRDRYQLYFENAVALDGPEIEDLCALSQRTAASLVLGIIEKEKTSLFCTAVFIDPHKGLVAKHRKLMPTGTERLIWSQGDGSTLPVVESAAGLLGAAICWENHMPLLRTAMYAKGVQIWCAPTVDERDIWQASMRHIAHEGRCFVISACQTIPSPRELGVAAPPGWDAARPLIRGGSVIVGPLGDILAGPVFDDETLLSATLDLNDIVKAKYDFDVTGHYARNDVFSLSVDARSKNGVTFLD